jgi:hypothetical protein
MKIHSKENNQESREHLAANKAKFSNGCLRVLELLRQGKRLTTINAPSYGILSLPRRIKDLRDHNGIENIVDEWDREKGVKVWYMNFKTEAEKQALKLF